MGLKPNRRNPKKKRCHHRKQIRRARLEMKRTKIRSLITYLIQKLKLKLRQKRKDLRGTRKKRSREVLALETTYRSRSVTWEMDAGRTIISHRKFKLGSTDLQKL